MRIPAGFRAAPIMPEIPAMITESPMTTHSPYESRIRDLLEWLDPVYK